MSWITPARDTVRGLKAYLKGWHWLRQHPRYLVMLALPGLAGLMFLVGAVSLLVTRGEALMAWLLFARPPLDAWFMLVLYYLGKVLLYVAVTVLTLIASQLFMNIAASPVYELISCAVEREVTGIEPPRPGLRIWLGVILVEMKKVGLILVLSILLLCIPGLNVLSTCCTAFLIGWDFFDYPLARRGWSLQQRLRLVGREFWAILGFGLWLVIPFAQVFLVPLAVAGGTMLSLEALQRQQLLTNLAPGRKVDASIQ